MHVLSRSGIWVVVCRCGCGAYFISSRRDWNRDIRLGRVLHLEATAFPSSRDSARFGDDGEDEGQDHVGDYKQEEQE